MIYKIGDYFVVEADSKQELINLVKENMQDWGWQPIGGVACRGDDYYCQAVVRYELDE